MKILVVDDEEQVRNVLKRLLEMHGYVVGQAADGAQALDLLAKESYDLMIIDRAMPNLNGLEAVAIIRSSRKLDKLKILMLTHASQTREVDEAYEKGIDGYIVKPFDMTRLVDKIKKALGA